LVEQAVYRKFSSFLEVHPSKRDAPKELAYGCVIPGKDQLGLFFTNTIFQLVIDQSKLFLL